MRLPDQPYASRNRRNRAGRAAKSVNPSAAGLWDLPLTCAMSTGLGALPLIAHGERTPGNTPRLPCIE